MEDLLPEAASSGVPEPTKVPSVQESPGTIVWDMKKHWRTRIREAIAYKDQPKVLEQILAMEQPNVIKHVRSEMERLQAVKTH